MHMERSYDTERVTVRSCGMCVSILCGASSSLRSIESIDTTLHTPTRYEYKLNAEFLVQILKIEHFIFKKIACGALGFLKASAFMDTGSKCYTFREPDPYASQPDGNVHFAFVLRDPSTHPKRPRRVVSNDRLHIPTCGMCNRLFFSITLSPQHQRQGHFDQKVV